jgi:hypothetical protein
MEGLHEGRDGVGNEGVAVVLFMEGLQRERDGEGGGRDTEAGVVVLLYMKGYKVREGLRESWCCYMKGYGGVGMGVGRAGN